MNRPPGRRNMDQSTQPGPRSIGCLRKTPHITTHRPQAAARPRPPPPRAESGKDLPGTRAAGGVSRPRLGQGDMSLPGRRAERQHVATFQRRVHLGASSVATLDSTTCPRWVQRDSAGIQRGTGRLGGGGLFGSLTGVVRCWWERKVKGLNLELFDIYYICFSS